MKEFFESMLPSGKKQRYMFVGLILVAFLIGWMINGDEPIQRLETDSGPSTTWTCSMHPQIQQPEPGQCPICGMDLIPVHRDKSDETGYREIFLSARARKLANIQVAPVERKFVETEIRMVGKIDYDETGLSYITAWVPGRIDRMFVDYTGISVRKGDHMVQLYSPELVSTQQELLQTISSAEKSGTTMLKNNINSIRERLRLWGLSPKQIQQIEKSKKVTEQVTITAPNSGIVIKRNSLEGMYVNTGTQLYAIAELSSVWLVLEAYEADIQWLRYGQDVSFKTVAYPGENFSGKIAFIDPVLNEKSRTIKVRVNVKNEESKLKPGMFVSAEVRSRIAAGGKVMDPDLSGKWISPMHPEVVKDKPGSCDVCGMALVLAESLGYISAQNTASLVIPASAALITGKRAVVYVQVQGKEGVFEGREITLGQRAGNYYILKDGLQEGEMVVVNGNFKIDSAIQIQAGPSMMNPQGGVITTGHQHGTPADQKKAIPNDRMATPAIFISQLDAVYDRYFGIQQALSHDNQEAAVSGAGQIIESLKMVDMNILKGENHDRWMKTADAIKKSAQKIITSENLDQARSGFKGLSEVIILLAGEFGTSGKQPVLVYHCPMAFDNSGADWLQNKAGTENPYFGSTMFKCGSQKLDLTHNREGQAGEHKNE